MQGIRRRGLGLPFVIVVVVTALVTAGCGVVDVAVLSHDHQAGRDNGTPGWQSAQDYLLDRMSITATGLDTTKTGRDAFKQPFDGGVNLLGIIPGSELPNEYVIVGGHYDHVGSNCRTADTADTICNGATDNATGAAAVLAVGEAIRARLGTPRRSVVLALWDREEDGLLGSKYYVQHPLVPLAQTVGYVNFDIQGANLLPSLRDTSFAIGAETGGAVLTSTVTNAIGAGPLHTKLVSQIFGQGRSDYANFIGAQVPTVFFSDSTGPCYHTAQDAFGVVDFGKMYRQIEIAYSVAAGLSQDQGRPAFVPNTPLATFADAVALQTVAHAAIIDLARFSAADQTALLKFRDDVDAIVTAGAAEFGSDDMTTLLLGAANAVTILTHGTCDGFLAP
jgi:hypothetical protein